MLSTHPSTSTKLLVLSVLSCPLLLRFVLDRCYVGDWFVLQQLSRNVNVYFFREFIKELRNDMRGHPKGTTKDLFSEESNPYHEHLRERRKERLASFSAESRAQDKEEEPPKEEEKQKSQYLLRIEHEQRLMPGMRGRRGRGRGKGRGGKGGKGKGRQR